MTKLEAAPRNLIDRILVPHEAFSEAQRRLQQCYDYADDDAREPVCMALIGESRTGKSRCIERFRSANQPVRTPNGRVVRVMHLLVPSQPTVKSLAGLGLRELGAVDWDRGSETSKTSRLTILMHECGVRALVLDEFHHFFDKASQKVQHNVADWLKNLVSETNVTLVVAGLPSLEAVVDQNEQLAGRFLTPVNLIRFDWTDSNHRSEWVSILCSFNDVLSRYFDLPSLGSDSMAFRLYCATGGLIGYLAKVLRQAVWDAIDDNRQKITMGHLRVAHEHAVWKTKRLDEGEISPLSEKWMAIATPELLARTKMIGVKVEPEVVPPTSRRTRTPRAHSVLITR